MKRTKKMRLPYDCKKYSSFVCDLFEANLKLKLDRDIQTHCEILQKL